MFAETRRHSDGLYQYGTNDVWSSDNKSTTPCINVTTNSVCQTRSLPGGTGSLSSDILHNSRTNIRSSSVNIPDNQRLHPPKKTNNRNCLVPLEVISQDEIDNAKSSQCYSNGMSSVGKSVLGSNEEFCLETDVMFKLHSRKYKKTKKSTKKSKSCSQVKKSLVAIPVNPRISSGKKIDGSVFRVSTQPNLQTNLEVLSAHCNAVTIHEQIDPKPPKSPHQLHRGRNLNNSKNIHASHSQLQHQDNRSGGGMSKSCVCQAGSSQIQLSKRSLAQAESVYLHRVPKVYLSEKHSGVIREAGLDFPCAPPATPTAEQLRRYEYVPSLNDVKSQRAVRHKLQIMEKKEQQKMDRKKDDLARAEKIHMKEREKELRRRQRLEIYALNKIMTDLEHKRFVEFCHSKGLVT